MDRLCWICKEKKVGIFAYWYGLRHCEPCDNLSAEVKKERLEEELVKRKMRGK